jgi:hypothetical protein
LLLLGGSAHAALRAVVVGNNEGTSVLPTLQYADDDALKLALALRQLDPDGRVELLTTLDDETRARQRDEGWVTDEPKPPTKAAVRAALVALAESSDAETTVIFFYAGHGQSGTLLLAGGEQLSGHELRSWLAAIPAARRFAFIDACRAQSLFSDRGGFAPAIAAAEEDARAVRLALITAATSQSPAGENAQLRAGYFSHVLTSGLMGSADVDGDGAVRFDELAAFVTLHTQRFSATRPWFEAPQGMLEEPVVRPANARQGLAWGAGVIGRQVVRGSAGTLLAEAHPGRSAGLKLALPAGLYRLEDWSTAPPAESTFEVRAGAFTAVDGVTAAPGERGTDYPTAESGFAEAFTEQVVRSWSTAFSAGQSAGSRAPVRLALDLSFAPSSGGFVSAFSWGLSAGIAARIGRFEAGALVDGLLADSGSGSERHFGVLVRGGYALPDFWLLAPRVDLLAGLRLWQFTAPDGRTGVDPTVPTFGAQASMDLLVGAGVRVTAGVRGELALPTVDAARAPVGTAVGVLGVRWLSPSG